MRTPETIDDLASELKAMTPRARRQVLARLTAAERARIERHLNEASTAQATAEATVTETPAPLSPWLARAIATARSGTPATMGPRTQAALLEIANAVRRPAAAPLARDPKQEPGRSLIEAFGGMLPTRRVR